MVLLMPLALVWSALVLQFQLNDGPKLKFGFHHYIYIFGTERFSQHRSNYDPSLKMTKWLFLVTVPPPQVPITV
jgi:hypothetical protein